MNMTFGFSMNFAASGSGNIIQQAMGMAGGMGSGMPMGSSAMGMGGIFGSDQVGFSPEAMMGGGSNFFHPLMESGMGMGAPMMGFGNGMGMVPGMMSPGMMGGMQNPMMLMQMMMLLKMLMGTMQQQGMGMGMGMPGMGMGGFGSPVGMEGCGGGFAPSGGCPGFGGGGIGMCPGFDFGNGGHSPIHHGGGHSGEINNSTPSPAQQGGNAGNIHGDPATGNRLADHASQMAGKHFKPGQTCRCADFVSTMIKQSGAAPPNFKHQVACRELQKYGRSVPRDQLKPGDIIYFGNTYRKGPYTHVGIYTGNGKFVHRPTADKPVRVDSLNSGYYSQKYTGARRLNG